MPLPLDAPSLAALQRAFAADVLGEQAEQLGAAIAPGRFSAERLLQVYRNNHFISLSEALRDCYPVVAALLGDGFFRYAAHQYVRTHPSRSGDLHQFGTHFAAFLADLDGLQQHPYVPDVARLEWARQIAYHAAEGQPIPRQTLDAVAGEDYPQLRFELHPSLSLLCSDYPIWRIWRAHQPDASADEDLAAVDLHGGGEAMLVYRPELRIEMCRLDPAEYLFLAALSAGETLATAAGEALEKDPAWPLQEALGRHLATAVMTALR